MSRLKTTFQILKHASRKALIPFITAGDPYPHFTVPALHAFVEAGADIIELGVPFSDPMADGPVIQRASERALAHRMSLRRVLELVREFRNKDTTTPLVLMGYLNPIEAMGYRTFAEKAVESGVDGVLTVDCPPEESQEWLSLLETYALDPIYLLAPNSTEARIRQISQVGRGYLYYVSLKGVTGASHLQLHAIEQKLKEIKFLTDLPVGVGFGIKHAETAATLGQFADAVVVGSALVEQIEMFPEQPHHALDAMVALLRSMRTALDTIGR